MAKKKKDSKDEILGVEPEAILPDAVLPDPIVEAPVEAVVEEVEPLEDTAEEEDEEGLDLLGVEAWN